MANPLDFSVMQSLMGPAQAPQANPLNFSSMQTLLGGGGSQQPDPTQQVPTQVQQAPSQAQAQDTPSWEPTQITPHQAYIDRVLMKLGRHPVYQPLAAQQDLAKVMPGFQSDPMGTINKIAMIPGMADTAAKLYQDVRTDNRLQGQADISQAAKKDLIMSRIGGMIGSATNQATLDQARTMAGNYIQNVWGMNPDQFLGNVPDTYDKAQINAWREGLLTPEQQTQEKEAGTREQIAADYHSGMVQAAQERADAAKTNAGAHEQAVQYNHQDKQTQQTGVQNRFDEKNPNLGGTTIMTKFGPGTLSKDGNKLIVPRNGTNTYWVKTNNGKNWQRVK